MDLDIDKYNYLKETLHERLDVLFCPLCRHAYRQEDLNWDTDPIECQGFGCPANLKLDGHRLMVTLRPAAVAGQLKALGSDLRFDQLLEKVEERLSGAYDDHRLESLYLLLLTRDGHYADDFAWVRDYMEGEPQQEEEIR